MALLLHGSVSATPEDGTRQTFCPGLAAVSSTDSLLAKVRLYANMRWRANVPDARGPPIFGAHPSCSHLRRVQSCSHCAATYSTNFIATSTRSYAGNQQEQSSRTSKKMIIDVLLHFSQNLIVVFISRPLRDISISPERGTTKRRRELQNTSNDNLMVFLCPQAYFILHHIPQ